MEIVKYGDVSFLKSEKIDVPHGFSLRMGGVSRGEFDSLNIGLRRGDCPFDAMKNIEICADALCLEKSRLTSTYQLHTSNVCFVGEDDVNKGIFCEWGKGVDGIVTDLPCVPLMCYSADCVPTLLYDPVRKMIGAVHGGWRGTSENIVAKAVDVMCEHGSRAEDIIAFIGPAIGMCCYEVSEVVGQVFWVEHAENMQKKPDGKYMLDLKNITKCQLTGAGLKEENIENCDICTSCNNDMFFSHRKQKGKSGLLGGFIQICGGKAM